MASRAIVRDSRARNTSASSGPTAPARKISHAAAARLLAQRDPVIARLLEQTGLPRFPRSQDTCFAALVRAIVSQQIAESAAAAIHRRLVSAVHGQVEPATVLALSDRALRSAGLSAAKAVSVKDLAAKVFNGAVELSPRVLARRTNAEITDNLSSVRGIGPWTSDMFLMWQLRRLDVWPTADLGVRRGYGLGWDVATPSARELEELGEPYRPYRSVLTWYCWRAATPGP